MEENLLVLLLSLETAPIQSGCQQLQLVSFASMSCPNTLMVDRAEK